MWLMLQQDEPDDYVIATGETHSIRELLELAFAAAGIDGWEKYVESDKRFMRPAEVDILTGDASNTRRPCGTQVRRSSPSRLASLLTPSPSSPSVSIPASRCSHRSLSCGTSVGRQRMLTRVAPAGPCGSSAPPSRRSVSIS